MRRLAWLFAVLPGCGGGCDELPAPALLETTVGDAGSTAPRLVGETATPAGEIEGHLGLRLPLQSDGLLVAAMPTAPGSAFSRGMLTRRCWFALGPRGLVANERQLLRPGPAPTADQVEAVVATAIPDWEARAGVQATTALIIVDARAEVATARALYAAVQTKVSGRVTALVIGADGQPAEVALPVGAPGR